MTAKGAAHLVLILFLGGLAACGPNSQFNAARKLEKKGKYERAWEAYQLFAAKHPKHELAPEALFRAGWLVEKQLKDCFMAQSFYDRVTAYYPQSEPWARAASLQKNNCPDYFPLMAGYHWTEVDSDTKGKNARIEISCEPYGPSTKGLPSDAGALVRVYYAGDKKSYDTRTLFKKTDSELLEFKSDTDPRSKTVLRWPFTIGTTWKTKSDNRIFIYEIVSVNVRVSVAAGEFDGCLEVKSTIEGIPGAATVEYYAPGVGRVLTAVRTERVEKRVTELASYKVAEFPEIRSGDGKP